MNLPSRIKLNQKHKGEKGSVTLFVLIAMLFFLIIGMMIFIINMNAETSQKRDVEKIKSEYRSNTNDTYLDTMYQEAKQRQLGKFVIKVIDSYKEIYNSGEWINGANADRLPLTIDANWPAGVASVEIVDHTGTGIRVNSEKALEDITFGKENTPEREGQYQITAKVDNNTDTVIYVNIDLTAPTASITPNGGTVWKGTEEETIQVQDASNVITLTASDNVSGVKEIQYIINNSSETPAADAEWQTYNESSKPAISNTQENGEYYIHVRAIDNAGNVSEVTNSEPYYVRQANYKVITATNGIKYAATLEEAAGIDGAEVIKVLRTFTDEVAATINNNVTLDTNGKTLTMANTIMVVANKTATFVDTATTKGSLNSTENLLINNKGNVIVGTNSTNGATLNSVDRVISGGTVTVNSGYLHMTGSKNLTTDYAGISAWNITVTGGEIKSELLYGIIVNNTATVTGGKITGKDYGIANLGSVSVSGNAQIIGTTYIGIVAWNGNATTTITGGTITGGGNGIHLHGNSNTVTIKDGIITGGNNGINSRTEASRNIITIGDNTTAFNQTKPVITGTNGKGINIEGTGSTLNYYDGKIIGATKATAAGGKRTFYGREVAFSTIAPTEEDEGTTVNFRDGYKPYTRQNTETNKWETVLEKQVNVTFNPGQGATVAENNRNVLTNVEYKEKAETAEIASLPTPTKTGYTFKGWNGKNLFNEDGIILSIPDAQYENGYYIFDSNKAHETYTLNYLSLIQGQFKVNTQYTFSILGYTTGAENNNLRLRAYYKSGNTTYSDFNLKEEGLFTFTTEPNETIDRLIFSYVSNTSVHAKYIQLEQGSTATSYEPYYITDNTKVVQDQDHTLTAIWEANKYTVHFDGDGATGGTMADQSFEYDEEKALTQNAFTREHIVTYDGNEGTPAKANDTATYTFANWGNKDILGYDLDMSGALKYDSVASESYNGYKTLSCDATNATSYKNMARYTINKPFQEGEKYKVTFYAKGDRLTTYFYGDSNYLRIVKSESSQDVVHTASNNGTYSDGCIDINLTDEWTKYSVEYTLGSYGDGNVNKYLLFRVQPGKSVSIYGVRFEKLENEEHADQEVVSKLTADPNGTVTLYAVWTPHEVTLPSATREGYIFNGWYDATTGGNKIGNAGDKYIPEANTTLYAQWRQVHYTVSVGEDTLPAETLAEAVGLAEERITGSVTTATITSLMNYADNSVTDSNNVTEGVVISKNITIDTNGHEITRANKITVAENAIATFVDTASPKGKLQRVVADGTRGDLITNNGTVNVGTNSTNGGNLESKDRVINGGTVTVYSGNIASKGKSENVDNAGIYSKTINIYGGNISNDTGNYGIVASFKGTCNISGGTVSGKWAVAPINGTLTVSGSAEINGRTYGVCSNGSGHSYTLNMTGGNITSTGGAGIYAGATNNITITGGTVTGTSGIHVTGPNCTLTIGNNSNALDKEHPVIQGTTGYSVNMASATSTLNYYDGKLIGALHDKTYDGRDVTFSTVDGTTVNPLSGYKPFTRQNTTTNKYETVLEKELTVTFEPNPGNTTGATVNPTSKTVLTNTAYGELPTPTKTGYSFKEWQTADNLISTNPNDWQQGGIYDATGDESSSVKRIRTDYIRVSPNTKYKLSVNNSNNIIRRYILYYNEEKAFIGRNEEYVSNAEEFTTPNNCYYIRTVLQYRDGETAISPSNVTDANIHLTETVTDSTIVTQENNHTLNAIWEANPYTVTADANGGIVTEANGWTVGLANLTANKDITYDTAYGTLPTVARTGYTFAGWFTASTGGTEVTAETLMQIANAHSIYAQWTPITYNITYNMNGGTNNASNPSTYTIETPTINLQAPTRDNFTFFGWEVNEGTSVLGSILSQTPTVTINNGTYTFTNATEDNRYTNTKLQLYSSTQSIILQLKQNSNLEKVYGIYDHKLESGLYRLKFAANGSKSDGYVFYNVNLEQGKKYYYEWENTKATDQEYKVNNFKFVEATGNTSVSIPQGSYGDKEFTAYWYANQYTYREYTATFDVNGGNELSEADRTRTLQYATPLGALPTTTKTGYDLAGWFTAATGGTEITAETKMGAANVTYYAHWTAEQYTVSFDANTGTGGQSEAVTATYDSAMPAISTTAPTKRGYTFMGWYDNADYTQGTQYYTAEGESARTWDKTADTTLYAGWQINQYTLTVDPNGGTWNGQTTATTVTQNYGTTYNVANNATKEGYVFGGWQLVDENNNPIALDANDSNIKYFEDLDDSQLVKQFKIIGMDSKKPGVYGKNGAVTHTIISDDTSTTGYSLEIETNGISNIGAGGFYNSKSTVAGTFYYHKIVAKIPNGYRLCIASNATGVGAKYYWLTSSLGTGEWKTYIYVQATGYNTPFNDLGYIYLTGTNNQNVIWWLQESSIYQIASNLTELQSTNVNYMFTDSNQKLQAVWSASGSKLTFDTQGGTYGNGTIGTEWTKTSKDYRYDTAYPNAHEVPYYTSDSDFAIYKTGYTLDGWYTEPNGQGTKLFDANGRLIPNVSGYTDANRTWKYYASSFKIYANWVANNYTVQANLNGGTIASADGWDLTGEKPEKTVTYDSAYGTLPSVSRTGYTFKGWSLLPAGYEQVEYINFNGSQYIDTAVLTKQSLRVEAEFSTTTKSKTFFGGRTSTGANSLVFGYFDNNSSYVGFGKDTTIYSTTINPIDGNKHKVILSNDIYQIDGTDQTINNRSTLTQFNNIYLGTWNNNGSADSRMYIGKIYSFIVYDGPEIVRFMIPCVNKSTGKAGFYDLANGVFYGKITGDDFTYGNKAYLTSDTIVRIASDHTITANWEVNNYTVTADLNGGTVTSADGWDTTGARPTKSVTYDSAYGTLPTVTKAGYTFDKWTGKNMFDEETLLMAIEGATYTDGHYQFSSSKSRAKYGGTNYLPIENFKENTSYTFSIYGYISNSWWHIRFDYTDGTTDYGKFEITEEGQYELSSNANKTLKYIKFSFGSNATVSISHIQLEEGTTATSYEPYKTITAESLVATDCNHTIHANWTANPYTVTADAMGGTIPPTDGWTNAAGNASATKTVYYDSTYGTLPTPTRDGYTFLGWYKENTFVNKVETSTQVTTDSNHTIYAKWINFTLSKNPIYMNKTTTSIALIAPEGTSGATVTYTGTDIGELTFESENTNVATVQINADNTQAAITTAGGAQTGDTTKIIIKDRESGLLLGELNVIIDTELPTWLVRLLSIE